ncbi:hypothetical protein LXT21_43155 [Myxococcus sp. K38C18041901]|uniref:hypothetical protein n=1 Tax=Myxococcus guangdongensis TaxID=2906760 RepID=UPI0020A77BAD|nr:hypothetical protein [Myxococcus guangdongensis]MCP3065586.1 hypothetical protein [Myxococcus guangdongensis]
MKSITVGARLSHWILPLTPATLLLGLLSLSPPLQEDSPPPPQVRPETDIAERAVARERTAPPGFPLTCGPGVVDAPLK